MLGDAHAFWVMHIEPFRLETLPFRPYIWCVSLSPSWWWGVCLQMSDNWTMTTCFFFPFVFSLSSSKNMLGIAKNQRSLVIYPLNQIRSPFFLIVIYLILNHFLIYFLSSSLGIWFLFQIWTLFFWLLFFLIIFLIEIIFQSHPS